jgi:formylglycine-generating enzyme required for sulfatase activity
MRFIDMFMAALGSLLFLALLLVFLLPKTTQQGPVNDELKKRNDELIAENQQLRRQIPQTQQAGGANTDEKNIVRRWFSVFLMTNGCNGIKLDMYVRWEGTVVNFNTEQPMSELPAFDASDISHRYDTLVGHRYLDIGDGPEMVPFTAMPLKEVESARLDDLNKNGLQAKLFYAVSRRDGTYSIYTGLTDPAAQEDIRCTIQPFYLSSQGIIPADKITLTSQRPFAWLRHFKMETNGTTTFGNSPWTDAPFRRDLAEFSSKQSKILCERKSLCGTMDAHYALLLSKPLVVKVLSPEEERALSPMDAFEECEKCPEMVVVPPGSFNMGSTTDQPERSADEGPQHRVILQGQFAVGRYAVTFDEWDTCVSDGGCIKSDDHGWGRDRRPVIGVSWDDAKAYVAWISRKTGKTYRLLSESELEYVTRAGTETAFWWGSTISPSQANYLAEEKFRGQTLPVDSFAPNPWGLFQVHGNVNEWTEDCYHYTYSNAPNDGSPWRGNGRDCQTRVFRGGSWADQQYWLSSGARSSRSSGDRSDTVGFRIARTLLAPNSSSRADNGFRPNNGIRVDDGPAPFLTQHATFPGQLGQ